MAGRLKGIELAKELGVTSKGLIVALGGVGPKSVRALTGLDASTAEGRRVKMGPRRELPGGAKPKGASQTKKGALNIA